MTELNIDEEDWGSYWASHYELCENLLTEHRTKVAQQMKNVVEKGKTSTDLLC